MLNWSELETQCKSCRECGLCETRTNVVFGAGSHNAQVLFIGEGPGEQEDLQGKPFVGRAGKLLDDMLSLIHLDRERIYIANIVKCRPPGNRDPQRTEQDVCIHWLRIQTALLKPKIVVCLGRIAAQKIINESFKITQEHGLWYERQGCRLTALYHPAALLRDPRRRPETFTDLKQLEAMIREVCPETYESPT
ncbi:MAG: uracil-DNA glycosylase [Oscillospiraceae bacterium]|nr:uracil-DNA glycosylase [Oscillospiraceae bacterium]